MTVIAVRLDSRDEKYSPPERALELSIINDVAFIQIYDYDESHTEIHMTKGRSIGVRLNELLDAIILLGNNDREVMARVRATGSANGS